MKAKFFGTIVLSCFNFLFFLKKTVEVKTKYLKRPRIAILPQFSASVSSWILFSFIFISVSNLTAQCPITNVKATVSGCYFYAGSSKATVSVEVAWTGTPGPITVTLSGASSTTPASRTITPGTIAVTYYTNVPNTVSVNQEVVSPQVVAFEIDANSASGITATATDGSCNLGSNAVNAPGPCAPTACSGQLGGMVFNDYNADGIKQSGEISGVAGVTITAFDNAGAIYTTTSDAFGKYVFSSGAIQYPVRVEFSNAPSYASNGTLNGTDGRTTVQFISGPDCGVDFGILNPTDFCQTTPTVIVPCYLNGDPTGSNDPALVSFSYDLTGSKSTVGTIGQMSSVWGVAYNKYTKKAYSASFLRRHVGLGPEGLGGIYETDMTTNMTTTFVDVENLGVNLGTAASNATRGVNVAKDQPSTDVYGFENTGKHGIGDIDISENGSSLYFVNLFEKKLHKLDIASKTITGSYNIPNPGCSGGEARPWAVKVYRGKVYIGVVCDAGVSKSRSDLRAYVYTFDESSSSFNGTPIFDFPLTYSKGFPAWQRREDGGWFPWTDLQSDVFDKKAFQGGYGWVLSHPQPILTDIEFDVDGSMVIGFGDRGAYQTGHINVAPDGDTGTLSNGTSVYYSGHVGGDILRAFSDGNGTYVIENAAKAGPSTGYEPTNNQGPGFGEFYNDDFIIGGFLAHSENSNGGLALRPGSGEMIYSAMDPDENSPNSGGVRKVNNTTGIYSGAYKVYEGVLGQGLFAKSGGVGDVELTCDIPTYFQIGNRIWLDTDNDGIQDPSETPLQGVAVGLYNASGTLISTKTTDANGEFYFNETDGVMAGTQYFVVAGVGQFNTGTNQLSVGGNDYFLTASNTGQGTVPDQNDNDGILLNDPSKSFNGFPTVNITTPTSGEVNHTFDFGFSTAPVCTIPLPTPNICAENILTNSNLETSTTNVFNDDIEGVSASFLDLNNLQVTGNTAAPVSWSNPTANGPIDKADYTGIFYINNNGNKMVWMRNNASASPAQCLSPIDYERYPLKECTRYLLRASVAGWSPSSIVTGSNGTTSLFLEYWIGPPTYGAGDSEQFTIPTTSDCGSIQWQEIEFEFTTGGSDPNNTINHAILVSLRDGQRDGLLVDNVQLCEMESCSVQNCTLAATCTPTPQTSCSPVNGAASVTVTGGQGNITYLWSSGETTASISGKGAGTYTVTVTDDFLPNCTATCQAVIGASITLPTATCTPMNNTNCATPNGSATVTTNGNQISWSTGATSASITGLSAGTYTVTVTNTATGCTNTCEAIVGSTVTPPTVTCAKTDNSNCATPNGTATATATGVTYLWSNGGTTAMITGLSNATYTVTVTSTTTGCTATCEAIVASTTTLPTATCTPMNNTNCATPNGSAMVTTNGNQILWSTGATTASITGLSNGTYTVTVTNTTTGCTNTCEAMVASTTTLPTATCTPMDNTNCATPNGSAMVTTNGNQILWSTGATSASITGLSAGTYTVTVTNTTTGCTNTCEAMVGSTTTLPTATCTPMNNTNCATPNGSATVTTNGNQILWSTGATTAMITGLSAGTYTVTVTNTTTGCTNTCQAVVGTTTVDPTCTITVNSQPSCANLTGGSITVNPNPAGTYSYNWSDIGSGSASRTGLTGGTYTVTVTNTTTGCTGVCQTTLDTPMNCCEITTISIVETECLDNNTPSNMTDNRLRVGIMAFNLNTSLTTYNVSVNGGTTISPTSGTYGVPTYYTLGPGTGGSGATFRITLTDSGTPGCTNFVDVVSPENCLPGDPPCPVIQCGTATIQVNNN